ncbi:MAG: hypothetical protein JSW02_00055 [candidate division WOR-3 bacterium]|nr:MAG: hypothetical protein JSW02_00055 [candidate division WOR-3 bacterium]
MKDQTWDDRFTAEGIPMTAPTNAGMTGSQVWQYEHQKWKDGRDRNKTEPQMACRSS